MNNLETVWSAGDLIGSGLAYTVMGIAVVFMILIIIMLVIKAMALFSVEKKAAPAPVQSSVPGKAEEAAPAVEAAPAQTDDGELIAVITAAVAAAMGKSGSSDFVIRSYKKVSGGAWNKAGRREVLDNRI